MNVWTITAGILGAAAMIGGPIAALEFSDHRYAPLILERIYFEDKVQELEELCKKTGDPVTCDRYKKALAELCRRYPESWLCP